MRLTTINEKALIDVATLLVGAQVTNTILAVYQLVDQAQAGAYELGRQDAEQNVETRMDAAFDEGFENGQANGDAAFDEGYLAGVRDARAAPAKADQLVAEILAADYYEGDSGDEQPDDNYFHATECRF